MPRKKTSKKQPVKKVVRKDGRVVRKLQTPDYRPFRLSKRIKHPGPKLSGSFRLAKRSLGHIVRHKKFFTAIAAAYLLAILILVRGFVVTADLSVAKDALTDLISGAGGQVAASLTVFGMLVTSSAPAGGVASIYQSFIVIIFSLFIIWTLRQTYAGERIGIKDMFYKSSYPLIPFIIVIAVIGLQLLPLVLGSFLYNATIVSGLSSSFAEVFAWLMLIFMLFLWSAYMISSSIFALYIVTLPDMTPLRALRSAKKLVQYRRWTVMRKVMFLPLGLMVGGLLILIPVILVLTAAAEVLFLILSGFVLIILHSYLYALYRELLDE